MRVNRHLHIIYKKKRVTTKFLCGRLFTSRHFRRMKRKVYGNDCRQISFLRYVTVIKFDTRTGCVYIKYKPRFEYISDFTISFDIIQQMFFILLFDKI